VTMTAELADTFASRREGVERLALVAAQQLPGGRVSSILKVRASTSKTSRRRIGTPVRLWSLDCAGPRCSSTWVRPPPTSCRSLAAC
jgi:hypothetical protein